MLLIKKISYSKKLTNNIEQINCKLRICQIEILLSYVKVPLRYDIKHVSTDESRCIRFLWIKDIPVNIVLAMIGQIIIDNKGNLLDVDTTSK